MFADRSTTVCDVLIRCDGLNSRIQRQMFLGSYPQYREPRYTGKTSYQILAPIEEVRPASDVFKMNSRCMYDGPKAYVLNYPVAQQTLTNAVLFVSDNGTTNFLAPFYSQGNVTPAGYATRASALYHRAGAGFGMEDASALATALVMAAGENRDRMSYVLIPVLETYNE